jgi:beta-lactamase regulating signal transducer with metallopeptidase domain
METRPNDFDMTSVFCMILFSRSTCRREMNYRWNYYVAVLSDITSTFLTLLSDPKSSVSATGVSPVRRATFCLPGVMGPIS